MIEDAEIQPRVASPMYSIQTAIEKVQEIKGLAPSRLFKVLYPLRDVEVVGIHEQGRPYELIEKYLERGIVEANLTTPHALADFFGLDRQLVDKVLAFLETMGHIYRSNGNLTLTDLGIRSVRENKKFSRKETRRKLYFEMFGLRALTRDHYDHRMRILSEAEAEQVALRYKFQRLFSTTPWNANVVTALGQHPDRAHYNVPDEIRNLAVRGELPAYLPMYIIETRKHDTPMPYYVVFTRIRNRRDEFFEHLVNSLPELQALLHAEEEYDPRTLWRSWLDNHALAAAIPVQRSDGIWQVTLTPEHIRSQQDKRFSIGAIGTYQIERGYFLQIWCNDPALRQEAALERTLRIIQRRARSLTAQDIQEHLDRFALQLQTDRLTLDRLRKQAQKDNMHELAALLDEFVET